MTASFDEAVLRVEDDGVVLVGGHCESCGRPHFPRSGACPACGATTTERALPVLGIVEATTVTSMPVLGASPPVTVVLVRLDPDVAVQGVAIGEVEQGDSVRLVGRVVAGPSDDLMAYGFERATP